MKEKINIIKKEAVNIPDSHKKYLEKINRIKDKFFAQNSYYPNEEYIYEQLDKEGVFLSLDEIHKLIIEENYNKSEEINDDFEQTNNENSPEYEMMIESLKKDIDRVLNTLTEKEAIVVKKYLNLDNNEDFVDKSGSYNTKISKELGIDKNRFFEIFDKAIRRLQNKSRKKVLEDYELN